MTDAEKELKRLALDAQSAIQRRGLVHAGTPEIKVFTDGARPSAVLALLDRIEALEADSAAMVTDLQAGDAKQAALTTAAQRASAELRHALRYRKSDGCIDTNLVSRAVVLLEEATTPNRPEAKP